MLPVILEEGKLKMRGLTFASLKCGKMQLRVFFSFHLWLIYYRGCVCFKKREAQNYTVIISWYLFNSFTESTPMWAGKWGTWYGIPSVFWICTRVPSTQRYREVVDCFSSNFDWPVLSWFFLASVSAAEKISTLFSSCKTLLKACKWPLKFLGESSQTLHCDPYDRPCRHSPSPFFQDSSHFSFLQ